MRSWNCFFFLSCLCVLGISSLLAHNDAETTAAADRQYYWIDIGFGLAGNRDYPGGGTSYGVSYLRRGRLMSLRLMQTSYFMVRPADLQTEFTIDELSETGVMLGKAFKRRFGTVSASAGLAYVYGIRKRNNERQNFSTIGVPLEIQLTFTPTPIHGIGFLLTVDMNSIEPFIGLFVYLQFGWLR